jgi:hypothetical protein
MSRCREEERTFPMNSRDLSILSMTVTLCLDSDEYIRLAGIWCSTAGISDFD